MNNFKEQNEADDEADDEIRQDKKKERQQYDKDRYLQNKEIYIERATLHRQKLREDIPKMKAKLKELELGKKIWIAKKTRIKYNITEDEIKLSQWKFSYHKQNAVKCENACSKNCYDIKARFTCGHYQCRMTTIQINRCIYCGCSESNEALKKETHNFLVECGIF